MNWDWGLWMDQFYKDQNNYFPYLAISIDINEFSFSNRGIDD